LDGEEEHEKNLQRKSRRDTDYKSWAISHETLKPG
jgi:hypothetical protein